MQTGTPSKKSPVQTARAYQRQLAALGVRASVRTGAEARQWGDNVAAVLAADEAYSLNECCGLLGAMSGCAAHPRPFVEVRGGSFYEFENNSVAVFYREG